MKKLSIRLIGLLAMALTAIPCSAQLSSYEWWFDNRQIGSSGQLSGSEQTVDLQLPTASLTSGLHTFHFRALQSDGMYSPVYTSTFLKFAAISGAMLEYWLDDRFDYRAAVEVTDASGLVDLNLDLSDNDKYPVGFHTLNFRVAEQGGNYSPIYTSSFMKFDPSQEGQMLEYWFDDGFENRRETMPLVDTPDGVMSLDLDMTNQTKFPLGLHQLHMRVAMAGSKYSPVYSAYVMRLAEGNHSEVSFWIDDDHTNRKVAHGNANSNIVVLGGDLDFSKITPGIHRLHYRITSNGYDDGVVYEEPILVKSRYRDDGNVHIVAENHWVDEQYIEYGDNVSSQSMVFTHNLTLNPNDYAVGQHVLYVAYKNSAQVWSETNATYFYKEASDPNKLKIGRMPTAIETAELGELSVRAQEGTIFVDSDNAGKRTTIIVSDVQGRVLATETIDSPSGIHATIPVAVTKGSLVIVRVASGKDVETRKIVMK